MKNFFLIFIACMIFYSCTPVIRQDPVNMTAFDLQFSEIRQNPELYKEKHFVVGGKIINLTTVKEGSLIEALYVPVDSEGHLINESTGDRYLALYNKNNGFLEQMFFHQDREITIEGEVIGMYKGKINELDYTFLVFKIDELYLWTEKRKSKYKRSSFHAPMIYNEQTIDNEHELLADNKYINIHLQSEIKVHPQSVAGSNTGEQSMSADSSTSGEVEITVNNKMLQDQGETIIAKQLLTKREEQFIHDKEHSIANNEVSMEKPEGDDLPSSEFQAEMNEKSAELPMKGIKIELQKSIVAEKKHVIGKYYIQVGAFRIAAYAERMLINLIMQYPNAYIFIENDFNKVRIPGVETKQEGIHISENIEKKFGIKPILVINTE